MGSGTSQADDLHSDRSFDLASSGFGLHYEITQNQGQSRTKAGSLTEEVVIGGRSRSQDSTANLWVNLAGYGNWTETNTSGWSESASQSVEDGPSTTNQFPTGKKGWAPENALAIP
ncbi:hypothetical protein [Planctopirus hydrillae]|uniref:Uncharacterized protein n=1 Tax=Planctopirus hydrillae TaxID=1841610 RepID=A0A1C3E4M8_9PLAN|nr:hypothetical protein [Planctopirus hydrillae]ODA28180.1 hypothetical protein A6X21_13485 [Planctopirus hydrillae]